MRGLPGAPRRIWNWPWLGRICLSRATRNFGPRRSRTRLRMFPAVFTRKSPGDSIDQRHREGAQSQPMTFRQMATLSLNLIIGGALGLPAGARGQEAVPSEYQMKAAFLYNFAKYVDWPASALPEHAPLVIGVFGEDPFGGALEEIL